MAESKVKELEEDYKMEIVFESSEIKTDEAKKQTPTEIETLEQAVSEITESSALEDELKQEASVESLEEYKEDVVQDFSDVQTTFETEIEVSQPETKESVAEVEQLEIVTDVIEEIKESVEEIPVESL